MSKNINPYLPEESGEINVFKKLSKITAICGGLSILLGILSIVIFTRIIHIEIIVAVYVFAIFAIIGILSGILYCVFRVLTPKRNNTSTLIQNDDQYNPNTVKNKLCRYFLSFIFTEYLLFMIIKKDFTDSDIQKGIGIIGLVIIISVTLYFFSSNSFKNLSNILGALMICILINIVATYLALFAITASLMLFIDIQKFNPGNYWINLCCLVQYIFFSLYIVKEGDT